MSYTRNDGISTGMQYLDLGDGDYESGEDEDWMYTSNVPIKTSNSNSGYQVQTAEDDQDDYYAKYVCFVETLKISPRKILIIGVLHLISFFCFLCLFVCLFVSVCAVCL